MFLLVIPLSFCCLKDAKSLKQTQTNANKDPEDGPTQLAPGISCQTSILMRLCW